MAEILRTPSTLTKRTLSMAAPTQAIEPTLPASVDALLADAKQAVLAELKRDADAMRELARQAGLREGRRLAAQEVSAMMQAHQEQLLRAVHDARVQAEQQTAIRIAQALLPVVTDPTLVAQLTGVAIEQLTTR